MIKWLLDEFLLILLLNILYDCVKFISYASYRNNHRKEVKFWPKIKILVALDIKNWGFQLKMAGEGSREKKMQQSFEKLIVDHDHWPLTMQSTGWATGRPVCRGWEFKTLPRALHFSHFLLQSLPPLHIPVSKGDFGLDFELIEGLDLLLGRIWARAWIWNPGFQLLGASPLYTACLRAISASSPCA